MKSLRLILSNPRYLAPALVFASLNIWFGTWAIYIPTVKEMLAIGKADLGFALFFLSLGVFSVFPIASKLVARLGVGRATWVSILCSSLFAMFPLIAPNYGLLCIALFFLGASNGFTDIAMNTLVTEIEKKDGIRIMSAAHGFYSLGGILVGLTSFLIPIIPHPMYHMLGSVVLILWVSYNMRKHYIHITAATKNNQTFNIKMFKPLFLLGLVAFVSMGSEGAIVDWSGLYLKEITLAPTYLIGAGFLAFSATMTLGRFLGDGISESLGSYKLLMLGAILCILGFVLVLTTTTILAIIGFGFAGLGFSAMVPELFRIGGKVNSVPSSQGVALIAGCGYLGFLSGPVLLGYLAETFNLKFSFTLLLCCAVLVFLIAFTKRKTD
ncbi:MULTISPECIES: MFS transporter [Flavobacteriaceae]|uniref:MFS transporter n=1 Tax=Flavobacteriaceae TaxID=49546 RepID=UPI0010ADC196|nr:MULTISPECIES: MFS transporter [Flavobacteriaceae]NJB36008.1 MFS transporter [Croceivirga sp. JEA036]TKD59231.1 MFS transporter [Flavobacterium sp. ASW18X]